MAEQRRFLGLCHQAELQVVLSTTMEVDCFHHGHSGPRLARILFERQRGAIEYREVKTGLGSLASLLDRMSGRH